MRYALPKVTQTLRTLQGRPPPTQNELFSLEMIHTKGLVAAKKGVMCFLELGCPKGVVFTFENVF